MVVLRRCLSPKVALRCRDAEFGVSLPQRITALHWNGREQDEDGDDEDDDGREQEDDGGDVEQGHDFRDGRYHCIKQGSRASLEYGSVA